MDLAAAGSLKEVVLSLFLEAVINRDEPTKPSQKADVRMKFPLCMEKRMGIFDTQMGSRRQNGAFSGGNPASCSPRAHSANVDHWGEPKPAVSPTGLTVGQCCMLLGLSPCTGSSPVSDMHAKKTDIKKTTVHIGSKKPPKTKPSHFTELDSLMSQGCWERCTPSEVKGDYERSASLQRCSVPRRLICRLIYPEHAFGELQGQQNTICRAESLIKRRSGTRLLPDNCYVRSRRANWCLRLFVIRSLTIYNADPKVTFLVVAPFPCLNLLITGSKRLTRDSCL